VKRIHVDEIEALPAIGGELQWKPVRYALGVDAFGINAYQGENEGDLVVEEHKDEHQELYVVVRGSARFSAGDEEFDAAAGTFVLLEPGEHRVAHALEPGTVVLAIGAESKRFEPSRWEYSFRGWALASLGRHDEGRRAIQDGLERYPDSPELLYDLACVEALAGDVDRALKPLREAIEREPKLAARAMVDEDFASIRGNPEFESAITRKPDSGSAGS
jgi:mannose-6-phosphate isomerase-like protein (cupin superfamily)